LGRRTKALVVPVAAGALDRLKYDVAEELGLIVAGEKTDHRFEAFLDRYKYEIAAELGLKDKIDRLGWPNMTTRECGLIGGRMGGQIGGRMVRRMIEYAEQQLK